MYAAIILYREMLWFKMAAEGSSVICPDGHTEINEYTELF